MNTDLLERIPGVGEHRFDAEGVAVVAPAGVDELATFVRWARAERIPLWPRSSTSLRRSVRPDGPGLVVDMSGLKEIIRVDRRNRVTLVQAGVTFEELAPALEREGLRAVMPLCPRRGKSVLATHIEREATIMPAFQWDLSDPLLCLELVYGSGDQFRTGSAAGPGNLDQQWASGEMQKGPMGPGHADWMRIVQGAQGTIGIATWASVKAEVLPRIETVHVGASDTLTPLVECAYRLLRKNAVDICFIVDANAFVDLVGTTEGSRAEAARRTQPWNLVMSVSGLDYLPERRHAVYSRMLRDEARAAGVRLVDPPLGSGETLLALLRRSSEEPYWKERRRGASRQVFFQTTLEAAGAFCASFAVHAAGAGIDTDRIGTYIQPQLGGRVAHVELIVACEPGTDEVAETGRFADAVAVPLTAEGAFFSRPYGAWAEPAFEAAASSVDILERAKTIFDPARILAPGRLGLKGNPDGYAF
ncbi:MAG: FAD-binding oxidoreductase [Acidimicrobiia bacterium]|nr:FAD-binding oxidoreductase [Acidimicrobiia bacterium]